MEGRKGSIAPQSAYWSVRVEKKQSSVLEKCKNLSNSSVNSFLLERRGHKIEFELLDISSPQTEKKSYWFLRMPPQVKLPQGLLNQSTVCWKDEWKKRLFSTFFKRSDLFIPLKWLSLVMGERGVTDGWIQIQSSLSIKASKKPLDEFVCGHHSNYYSYFYCTVQKPPTSGWAKSTTKKAAVPYFKKFRWSPYFGLML